MGTPAALDAGGRPLWRPCPVALRSPAAHAGFQWPALAAGHAPAEAIHSTCETFLHCTIHVSARLMYICLAGSCAAVLQSHVQRQSEMPCSMSGYALSFCSGMQGCTGAIEYPPASPATAMSSIFGQGHTSPDARRCKLALLLYLSCDAGLAPNLAAFRSGCPSVCPESAHKPDCRPAKPASQRCHAPADG